MLCGFIGKIVVPIAVTERDNFNPGGQEFFSKYLVKESHGVKECHGVKESHGVKECHGVKESQGVKECHVL